tara:strand:+ start:2042 stop:2191 length:150 start_codon:yes stop_codon:yes gene_type:complete
VVFPLEAGFSTLFPIFRRIDPVTLPVVSHHGHSPERPDLDVSQNPLAQA